MKAPHVILLLGAALLWAAGHARAQQVPDAKTAYLQVRDAAASTYKRERAQCNAITGNPKAVCVAEAKATRVRAEEEASAAYQNTPQAYTRARLRIAAANFARDKARCKALAGNERDVCTAQARAVYVSAKADARADDKAIEARAEARADKLNAAYRVAMEKCDAFAGAAKDQCVAAAKAAHGQ